MNVRYAFLDPTGNRTLLVETATPVPEQPALAARLMALEPSAEQVGFLTVREDGTYLRMAGGEFCGNAVMCAAALLALDGALSPGGTVRIRVSGAAEPVPVTVAPLPDGSLRGRVSMPRPISVGVEPFPDGIPHPVVRFEGIAHVILEDPLSRAEAESLAPVWCRRLAADALGLMLLDREAGTLTPLVYVPAAGTLCWENSCASGTTAVGAFLAAERGATSCVLRQPGGTLQAEVTPAGELFLTGSVRLLRRTQVSLDE